MDAPAETRSLSAWFDVGLADGARGAWHLVPRWASREVRQAWWDGFRMGRIETREG